MIEVVRKPRLASQVAASLCTYMIERGLQPGDRLPSERELAAAVAVSRQVVREALGHLQSRGLVAVDHGRTTSVKARPTPQDLSSFVEQLSAAPASSADIALEARAVFEAGLADLIVSRATEADIARLDAIVASMRRAVSAGQPGGADDVAFHEQLLRCTSNGLLIKAGQRLVLGFLHSALLDNAGGFLKEPEELDLAEHEEIVDAIRRRDVERLRVFLRYHGYQFDSAERLAAGLPSPRMRGKTHDERGQRNGSH
jgi:GntR family transcriptional repressor for pyruvate dehydrogenase complex